MKSSHARSDSLELSSVPLMTTLVKSDLRSSEESFERPASSRVCVMCDSDDVPYSRNAMYPMCIACQEVFDGFSIEPAFTSYIKSCVSQGKTPQGVVSSGSRRKSGRIYIPQVEQLFIVEASA